MLNLKQNKRPSCRSRFQGPKIYLRAQNIQPLCSLFTFCLEKVYKLFYFVKTYLLYQLTFKINLEVSFKIYVLPNLNMELKGRKGFFFILIYYIRYRMAGIADIST